MIGHNRAIPHAQHTENSRSRRTLRLHLGPGALVLPGAVLYLVFVAAPFAVLALYSFYTAGFFSADTPLTLGSYRSALSSSLTWQLTFNSAEVGIPVAVVTMAFAMPVAYWLRFSARRLQGPVIFLLVFTIFAGYLVRIYAWRTLLGDHGVLNEGLVRLGVIDHPLGFLLFSRFSVTLGLVHILLPVATLLMLVAMRPLEPGYLEAARDLGAGAFRLTTRVVLPAVAAPATVTALLVFLIASSDWVTPQLLGDGKHPMLGQWIAQTFQFQGNYPGGAALSLMVLAAFGLLYALLAIFLRSTRLDRLSWGDAAPGARFPSKISGGVTAFVLIYLYAPLAVVVLFSFHSSPSLSLPFQGFSLRWYSRFLDDPVGTGALVTSFKVAAIVSVITLVLGTATALGLGRLHPTARALLGAAFYLPLTLPPIFIGLSLFTFFARTSTKLSLTTVVIGHVVVTLPLFLLIARTTLERLDSALEETASDLGASGFNVFRRVTLPQIWPALAAGMAISFAVSFDEFPVTAFVVGQQATLPFYIFGRLRTTIDPTVNVISTMVMGIVLVVMVVSTAMWLIADSRRRRVRGVA